MTSSIQQLTPSPRTMYCPAAIHTRSATIVETASLIRHTAFAMVLLAMSGCDLHDPALPELPQHTIQRVDTLYGDHHLDRLVSFIPLDSSILLASLTTIHILDPAWHEVRQLGRSGQGPAEFGAIRGIAFRGDSLFVLDSRNSRVTVLDPHGKELRAYTVHGDYRHPNLEAIRGRIELVGGRLVFSARANPGPHMRSNRLLLSLDLVSGEEAVEGHAEGPLWGDTSLSIVGWHDPFGAHDIVSNVNDGTLFVGNGVDDCLTTIHIGSPSGRPDRTPCLFPRPEVAVRWNTDTDWIPEENA